MRIEVGSQAEFDAAILAHPDATLIVRVGSVRAYDSASVVAHDSASVVAHGSASVEAYGSASVEAYGSAFVEAYGSAFVEAHGSASVVAHDSASVVAYGSASVVAYDSASVRAYDSASVEAYGSASVVAHGSASVRAYGSASVEASAYVAVIAMVGHRGKLDGGVIVRQPITDAPAAWCDYYGIVVVDGVATIYKAVDSEYRSPRGALYVPGSSPEAKDWDGDARECGGGLHFSPRPAMALEFNQDAKRFVACPVALSDMRSPQPGDLYPQKIKARRVCGPIVEVDRHGRPVSEEKKS
jgi:hypothetical protein